MRMTWPGTKESIFVCPPDRPTNPFTWWRNCRTKGGDIGGGSDRLIQQRKWASLYFQEVIRKRQSASMENSIFHSLHLPNLSIMFACLHAGQINRNESNFLSLLLWLAIFKADKKVASAKIDGRIFLRLFLSFSVVHCAKCMLHSKKNKWTYPANPLFDFRLCFFLCAFMPNRAPNKKQIQFVKACHSYLRFARRLTLHFMWELFWLKHS